MTITKLKAGALQMVLYISVIIAIMLTAFILLVHTHEMFEAKTGLLKQTVVNANTSMYQFLDNDKVSNSVDSLQSNFWGVYTKVAVTSRTKNFALTKSALTGASRTNKDALFLEDRNKPLVVVGHATISGRAHLPSRGIKSGQIAGKSYYGSDLRYGDYVTISKYPKIAPDLKTHLTQLSKIDSVLNTLEVLAYEHKEYLRSFKEAAQVLYSPSKITLSDTKIIGHYVIASKQAIEVEASAKLTDVILIAPEVIIRKNVKGAFQVVASAYIEVKENCKLRYPSTLTLIEEDDTSELNKTPQIIINKKSEIKGAMVYLGASKKNVHLPNIFIAEDSKIYGEVYCENNLDLRGTVNGTVITTNFIAAYDGSIYQNHLFNGKILATMLPDTYVGVMTDNSDKGIAKWLY